MTSALEAIELETGPNPTASVVWLHGLGADGNDFVPVADELALPDRAIRFVFPHAPHQPVTINGGMVMRAWYDILSADLERRADERGVRASQALVESLLEREKARGISSGRIVLAGFSQGGAIALQTGLRHPARLAGILALSCYVPLAASLDAERAAANAGLSVFLAHGLHDEIVPVAAGRRSRDLLAALGYAVEWHEYAMAHSVCMEEIEAIGTWLRRVLG
jgi:phospholipase/carboxylesterase